MPEENKTVTEAELLAKAAQEKANAEENEIEQVPLDVPVNRTQLVQGAAVMIRDLTITISTQIKPSISTARHMHNETEAQRLAALQAGHERTIRILLRDYPEARELLKEWSKAEN